MCILYIIYYILYIIYYILYIIYYILYIILYIQYIITWHSVPLASFSYLLSARLECNTTPWSHQQQKDNSKWRKTRVYRRAAFSARETFRTNDWCSIVGRSCILGCSLMVESWKHSLQVCTYAKLDFAPFGPRLILLKVHMEKMTSKGTTKQASMWQLARSFLLSICSISAKASKHSWLHQISTLKVANINPMWVSYEMSMNSIEFLFSRIFVENVGEKNSLRPGVEVKAANLQKTGHKVLKHCVAQGIRLEIGFFLHPEENWCKFWHMSVWQSIFDCRCSTTRPLRCGWQEPYDSFHIRKVESLFADLFAVVPWSTQ